MARIVIAAGGTAGHVVPALAVADELRDSGAEVSFAGTRERAEAELVPRAGYPISFLKLKGIDRRNPARAAQAVGLAAASLPAARKLLRDAGADAVMGGGGYIAGPVGLAAAVMRIPLVLTEADSHLGVANRALAPFARRVCLSFPIEGREPPRYLVTGRPIPRAVVAADPVAARYRLGIDQGRRCLLVFGGSLGARTINECAFAAFAQDAPADLVVVHIAGRRDYPALAARLKQLGNPAHYRLYEYMATLADPLAAADLVLARSGGSVFEIAAAGKPAVLVPYPDATADHQTENARWMADAGAALVMPDAQLQPSRLGEQVGGLLADADALDRMAAASRSLARPDAARAVADQLLAAAGGVHA